MPDGFPGLTDIHAHPAMNAWLWSRDLNRHFFDGSAFNPLASTSDFKMLRKGDVRVVWSSAHIPESAYFDCRPIRLLAHVVRNGRKLLRLSAWECLNLMMDEMERQVARTADFDMAPSNADLDRVLAAGKRAVIHTVEGGHVLGAGLGAGDVEGRLARLGQLSARGVASLTIAHLFPNDLAGHTEGIPPKQRKFPCRLKTEVDLDRGLTEAGRAVVERMVQLRMVPDVAHCTPKARQEIYTLVGDRIPVIASHNGVTPMKDEPYNLGESDVSAIAASNGVVGVIFMPYWLHRSNPGPGRDVIWETIETLRGWSGGTWEHIAIGTDFDGFTDPPDDYRNASTLGGIRELLRSKGLTESQADAVLGGNARRVLAEGWR